MIYTPFKNADVKSIFKITGSASAETSSVIAKYEVHYGLFNEPKVNSDCCL